MPINELEQHPFLDYLQQDNIEIRNDYKGLIIGSFPVFSLTNSLDNNLNIVAERFDLEAAKMRFFYGSNLSHFWEYISSAIGEQNPTVALPNDNIANHHLTARQRTISFLQRNKLYITDSLFQTNRIDNDNEDSDLWITNNVNNFIHNNLSLNTNIIEILEEHKTIQNLYFTATGLIGKTPFGWFRQIFGNNITIQNENIIGGRRWSFNCLINGRKYNIFMLPTPKSRGIHFTDNRRTQMFVNYLQSHMNDFYNEIEDLPMINHTQLQKQTLSVTRINFLIECYRQAFVFKNLNFDGQL